MIEIQWQWKAAADLSFSGIQIGYAGNEDDCQLLEDITLRLLWNYKW